MRARLDRLPPNHPSSPAYRRAHDTPRQADQQPERQRSWYAPHAIREQAIERQRRTHASGADPQRWRAGWYRRDLGDVPAPFRQEVAERVTVTGRRSMGRLDRHDGGDGLPLESGYKTGLVDALKQNFGQLPEGFTRQNETHVEAHAAAWLRLHPAVRDATLYVMPLAPCPGPRGCDASLPAMLPEGARLTVYGPAGFLRVYHGLPDEQKGS
jgi:SCP1.201-like deaminase